MVTFVFSNVCKKKMHDKWIRKCFDAMTYPHRSTAYTMNIHGRWQSPELDNKATAWVRELFNHIEVFSTGSVYVNFVPENGEIRKIGPYEVNKARLEKIKAQVDPNNLFHTNINIKPRIN
jgi:FAD/FMN-containing dehydrogenase